MLPAATALVAVALLVGCVPQDPVIAPVPEPSSSPVFASDEEALAAATEAYGRYLEVTDAITAKGDGDVKQLVDLVTPDQLARERAAIEDLAKSDKRAVGKSSFAIHGLQQFTDFGDGTATVMLYICVDVSSVRVLDSNGTDLTPRDRINFYPLEVEFRFESEASDHLLIARSETWPGTNFCS